ncbi:hypothetical protein SESBI_23012 [Sesbania bispinosa]|nr:hypothetical protein SESBI_23012 [Sesbania bispinosa]
MEKETIDLNGVSEDTSMYDQGGTNLEDFQYSAPNVDSFSLANALSNQSTWTSGSWGTKQKALMIDLVETQVEKMSTGIGLVAEALNSGNAIFDKLHNVVERLKFPGEKYEVANIHTWESYDHNEVIKGMIRRGLQQPNKVNADIPYAMLITKILEHYGVDTANERVIEQHDHVEVAGEAPIAGTTNVTHVQSMDDNMQRILIVIEGLHNTVIEHHNKVEKKIEELVNHIQAIDRLPQSTLG